MTKARVIVLACFCAAFVAGAAVGMAWTPFARTGPHGSRIVQKLDLTREQREKMRDIWSEVMGALREQRREQRRAIREEREESIRALLSEEQKLKYEEVIRTYEEKTAGLDEARRKAFEDAVERTKQILTEDQRKKYEEMMKERSVRWGRGPRPGGRSRGGHGETPSEGGT